MEVRLGRVDLSFDHEDFDILLKMLHCVGHDQEPAPSIRNRARGWLHNITSRLDDVNHHAHERTHSVGDLTFDDLYEPDMHGPLTMADITVPGEVLPADKGDFGNAAKVHEGGFTTQVAVLEEAERINYHD